MNTKHEFEPTDTQGHIMECVQCGRHINIDDRLDWDKAFSEDCKTTSVPSQEFIKGFVIVLGAGLCTMSIIETLIHNNANYLALMPFGLMLVFGGMLINDER